ncbi:DUF421 domain-containing protein [Pradoshia sp. D12]|nr:DUF421 domain-containing protein [Pradoshia sp. D12]TPF71578.1 DUF421 domain-containing protein [Bacillus sp. D12]
MYFCTTSQSNDYFFLFNSKLTDVFDWREYRLLEYLEIIGRTSLLYVIILLVFRIMGKREIGELSLLDLVVFMMMADIAVIAIENPDDSMWKAILPIAVISIIQIILAFISLKVPFIRKLIDGKPSIIIHNGKIDKNAMRMLRYNFDDLLIQLRDEEVEKMSDVEFAIFEPSGKLSIYKKKSIKKNKQPGPIFALIQDGVIQKQNLREIGKSESWLIQELAKKGYTDVKQILFCSLEDDDLYINNSE